MLTPALRLLLAGRSIAGGVDNVTTEAVVSPGAVFATDDIGGVHHPRTKIQVGADGSATDVADGAAALPIRDGGNSITVDGPLTDAQLRATPVPVSGPLTDAQLRATPVPVATQEPISVDDNGGSLTVDGTLAVSSLPALVAGTANIGDVDVASMPTGASAAQVQGTAAHDAAVSQNPVTIAARANANEPAAVSADADATHLWADLLGRLVVHLGHPNPEAPVSLNATASGGTSVIAAPGASTRLVIRKGSVHNRASTNRLVRFEDGSGGTIRWRAELAAEGGGASFDFGSAGWRLTANTALFVNLDAAGDIDINITEYSIEAT